MRAPNCCSSRLEAGKRIWRPVPCKSLAVAGHQEQEGKESVCHVLKELVTDAENIPAEPASVNMYISGMVVLDLLSPREKYQN